MMNLNVSSKNEFTKKARRRQEMKLEDIDLRKIKSTLVITFNGRSGSYLLSNLLDNHSKVLSCPPHSIQWVMEKIDESFSSGVVANIATYPKELVNWIINNFPLLFKSRIQDNEALILKRLDISGMQIYRSMLVEVELFREIAEKLVVSHLKRYENYISGFDILPLIHWAYALARGRRITTDSPIISWQRHNFINDSALDAIETHIRSPIFLTTIRQPEDALDSMLNWLSSHYKTKKIMFRAMISAFACNFNKRQTVFPQWAIRFEDIHRNTEALMKKLCARLDIPFEPTLLKTTLDGETSVWEVRGKSITGTNQNLLKNDTFLTLTPFDIIFFNLLFARYYDHFGYEMYSYTTRFINLDPRMLTKDSAVEFMSAIQDSKLSYLANLTFEPNTDDLCHLRTLMGKTWNLAKEPLEVISV